MRGPGTKPPWPAWDWSPSGHRGVVLALQPWGVAVRKESHRTLPVPGERLLLPGLLSGVVPTASVPAVAASCLALLSSEPEVRAARALWGGESAGCSALHSGDWRVDSNLGVGEALVCWGADAREAWRLPAVSVRFGRLLPWSPPVVNCISGPSWTRGGRREWDVAFGMILGSAFPPKPKARSVRRLWSLLIIWVHLQRRA